MHNFDSTETPIDYTALKSNFDHPLVMNFHMVTHLARLVCWERRKTAANKQTDRHYVNLYIYIFFY